MLDGILVWKGRDVLFHVIILLVKVKDCLQLAVLFKNAQYWYGLAYGCGDPPACAGVPADLLS